MINNTTPLTTIEQDSPLIDYDDTPFFPSDELSMFPDNFERETSFGLEDTSNFGIYNNTFEEAPATQTSYYPGAMAMPAKQSMASTPYLKLEADDVLRLRAIAMPSHFGPTSTSASRTQSPTPSLSSSASSHQHCPVTPPQQKKRKSVDLSCSDSDLEDHEEEESAQPKPKSKKTAHNQIEKRYRNNLNDKICDLKYSVPTLRILMDSESNTAPQNIDLEGLQPATKLNKATILAKAVEYIQHLERKNEMLRREKVGLVERVVAFENLLVVGEERGCGFAQQMPQYNQQMQGMRRGMPMQRPQRY